jgi:hypothetical protein
MNGKYITLRIVSALVLVAVLAGIAFFAYQAGVAQGSPVTIEAPSGETVPAPYPYYGYGLRYHHPFMWGFGCLIPLIGVFLLVLALKAFRFAVWGPRWEGWGHRGHWSRHWEGGIPPMFEEWHKRSHGEQSEEKKE